MPRPPRTLPLLALVACLCLGSTAWADPSEARLAFLRDGSELRELSLSELRACCAPREVVVDDPYYGGRKRFRAFPLAAVLEAGFGADALRELAGAELLLRALDGYTRTASGAQLLGEGAFLAFADVEHPDGAFFPIDRRQVDPAPFYLVWQGEGRSDTALWPWPYQLAQIERVEFARAFPHVVPRGAAASSAVHRGFATFRASCLACHAINGEGGSVGPDLNVPRSIVEYREPEQLKRFIRNPRSFRYTSMPAHEHLSDADLDALIAYFTHMSGQKRDPGMGAAH